MAAVAVAAAGAPAPSADSDSSGTLGVRASAGGASEGGGGASERDGGNTCGNTRGDTSGGGGSDGGGENFNGGGGSDGGLLNDCGTPVGLADAGPAFNGSGVTGLDPIRAWPSWRRTPLPFALVLRCVTSGWEDGCTVVLVELVELVALLELALETLPAPWPDRVDDGVPASQLDTIMLTIEPARPRFDMRDEASDDCALCCEAGWPDGCFILGWPLSFSFSFSFCCASLPDFCCVLLPACRRTS